VLRVAFYTGGSVGAGHLARALAIRNGLARSNVEVDYRIFYAQLPVAPPPGVNLVVLSTVRKSLKESVSANASETAEKLREFAPDLLLVDLAWFDLKHLLPIPGTEAWLLLRWCHPQFLRGPFNREFKEEQYERIIGVEPTIPFAVPESVPPVVIANRDECHPIGALRARLGVEDGVPITLIAQAGLPGERELLVDREERRNDGHRIVVASLADADLFPIAPWLPGADRIVGGAGYNLYWETRWLGLAERTEYQIFRRRIDDQTPRMKLAGAYEMRENGADVLARLIAGRAQ
jgi:hypothetical protein